MDELAAAQARDRRSRTGGARWSPTAGWPPGPRPTARTAHARSSPRPWRATCPCRCRPSGGRASCGGSRWTRSRRCSTRTALFRTQWGFGRDQSEVAEAALRDTLARARAEGVLTPPVVYGYFACNVGRQRPAGLRGARLRRGRRALGLPAADRGAAPVHRRLLPLRGLRRARRAGPPLRDHGIARLGPRGRAVRRRPLHRLPLPARPGRRDGRGHGRVLPQAHPRRAGHRRRRRRRARRPVPPGLPAAPLLASATPPAPTWKTASQLFDLLDAARIGLELSEEFQLHPEQSTDALIVHHPEAKYFNAR